MNMQSKPFRDTMRCTAAWAVTVATIALLHIPPALAGEVRTTDCIHGFSEGQRSDYSSQFGSSYGNGYGNSYSSGFSGEDQRGFDGGFTRGFGGRFRHRFIVGSRSGLYGGSNSGAEAGTGSGYDNGYGYGTTTGSRSGSNSDSCVEIRHELTNPYVIHVQPQQSAEDARAVNERERLWRARCRPVAKQDAYGVSRYAYAAPGCEYGRYE